MQEKPILPWKPVTKNGYGKLDLVLTIGEPFGSMVITRQLPNDKNPGAFTVFHNANRISERVHAKRSDAIAEAERYFYANPMFAQSSNATLLNSVILAGRNAYAEGMTLYDNPYNRMIGGDKSVERAQWAEGWLQAYATGPVANAMQAANQINAQLVARIEVMQLAITFSFDKFPTAAKGKAWLKEWATSNDPEGFNAKYPEWAPYRDGKEE